MTPPTSSKIPSSPSNPTKTSSNSPAAAATQACASCKYQRRRCTPDCTLAPYFPADQQPQFLNAHRLFGVSKILKIARNLDPASRDHAMASIVFHSNARAADPVGGCYRIALDLQRQIDHCSMELALVLRQLELCRAAQAESAATQDLFLSTDDYANSNQQQQQYFNCFYDGNENNNGLDMEMLSFQQKGEDEDVKPLVDIFAIGGDEEEELTKAATADVDAFYCSTKTTELKDDLNTMEHVQEHDLKEAASLFTLTNCNTSTV